MTTPQNEEVQMRLDVSETPWLTERIIFLTYAGSISYGTTVEGSDKDVRGIAIPPPHIEHGLGKSFEQHRATDADTVIYGLKTMFRGLCKQSPNMLEMLFVDPKHHLLTTPALDPLIKSRSLFLSRALADSHLGAVRQLKKKVGEVPANPLPGTRKMLMHMVRYLLQARDLLLKADTLIERPAEDGLMDIRLGKTPVNEILDRIAALQIEVYDAIKKSSLPDRVNMAAVDVLYRQMLEDSWDYEVVVPIMGNWKSQKLTYSRAVLSGKNLVKE